MSINPVQHTPLHPAWCSPDAHQPAGADECWHRSDAQSYECADSLPGDRSVVEVSVEQYSGREDGEWQSLPATVFLTVTRSGCVDLTAHEGRLLARRLLAAADIADGLAVSW